MENFQPSLQAIWVLRALYDDLDGEHYGFSISKTTGLKSGTLYPILARLETHGLVISKWEQVDPTTAGRPPRRFYSLSATGIKCVEEELRKIGVPYNHQPVKVN